jgi:hypothetical protein
MTNTTVLEQIKDALSQALAICPRPSIREMLESFYGFIDLYAQRNNVKSNQEEFDQKLHESYRNLYQLAEKAAAELGIDSKTLQQWIADPTQISSGQFIGAEHFKNLKSEIKTNKLKKIKKQPV